MRTVLENYFLKEIWRNVIRNGIKHIATVKVSETLSPKSILLASLRLQESEK